jgi:hypothetical protein
MIQNPMTLVTFVLVLMTRFVLGANDPSVALSSWHACNDETQTPLFCAVNGTYSRIDLDLSFKLSAPADIIYEQQWTVLPKRNQDGTGEVLFALDKCPGTCQTMVNNKTTITIRAHRPRIAYPLREVTPSVLPYGLWFSATNANSPTINVTAWFTNTSVLTPQSSCTGYSATLANGDACYPLAPPSITSLVNSDPKMCGAFYDVTHINQSKWTSYPLPACKAAVCNQCGTTPTTTVMRAFPFGVSCRVFEVTQPSYFLDVSIVTQSGVGITEAVYTSTETPGTGVRRSLTQYSRAAITSVRFANNYVPIPPATAEGGIMMICSKNVSDLVALDQGFLNPWVSFPDRGAGGMPTTNYLGGELMWYYLRKDEAVRVLGADCGQYGGLGPVTNLYDNVNETQRGCEDGSIQAGACVPGYLNDTFTSCQVASTMNRFTDTYDAAVTLEAKKLLVAPFVPPGWNTSAPNMWFHSREASGLFLMQQMRQLTQPVPLTMSIRYEISNDILLAGINGGGVLYDALKSRCVFSGSTNAGAQQVRFCNTGADTQTVLVDVSHCQHIRSSNNSAASSLNYTSEITLKNSYSSKNPNNCATTDVTTFVFDQGYFPLEVNSTQVPTYFGSCQLDVWNPNRTIKLIDNDTLHCFYLPYKPLFTTTNSDPESCSFIEFNCFGSYFILIAIILAVLALFVALVLVGVHFHHKQTEAENASLGTTVKNQFGPQSYDMPSVPLVNTQQ